MHAQRTNRPNVVMIVHDSVRAESCSCYGYERPTTPYLESLAGEAVLYRNAFSAAVSTVPSHGSIFTGTPVYRHGLFLDGVPLSRGYMTVAEALKNAGYRTFGVCYQDDVSPVTGLHRGFDEFDMDDEPGALRRLARRVIDPRNPVRAVADAKPGAAQPSTVAINRPSGRGWQRSVKASSLYRRIHWWGSRFGDMGAASTETKARRFLDADNGGAPFFMYLHFDETHLPYRPPSPFREQFLRGAGAEKPAWSVNQDRSKYFLGEIAMDEEDFAILRGLYDGSIAYLDAKTADLARMLKERGYWDNTVFIVLGDHGDNIGEHGLLSHKYCVYDTLTKVPLIVKYPRELGLRGPCDDVAQLTDLAPTLLDVLGIEDERLHAQVEGNSLVSPAIRRRDGDYAISELIKPFGNEIRHMRGKLEKYDRRFLAIRSRDHKYIFASDGRDEFYDLALDPGERRNRIDASHPEKERLRALGEPHWKAHEACFNAHKDRF